MSDQPEKCIVCGGDEPCSHNFDKLFVEQVPGPSGIELAVCRDIAARQRKGIQKYGMTVADNPLGLREWLQHAYEECLDQAIYLKKAIAEIDVNTEYPMSETSSGCPKCGASEVECESPYTQYACGSSDYDQRPGTFRKSETCKRAHEKKIQ